MSLKVLMFGWEFPPYNSGGLGVACYGLTKALAKQEDIEITFVLPKRIPIDATYMKFAFAGVEADKIKLRTLDTALSAYITSQLYISSKPKGSQYGSDLIAEVLRYGELAAELARKEDFDIIHAHDWLSFPAGIAAKRVSGKPLILHVHATESDRTGGNGGHPDVLYIEKHGLELADRVAAVSQYTKDKIMHEYQISGDKIEVVHNGIDHNEVILEEQNAVHNIDGLDLVKSAGQKLVLFLGRFTIQKGADKFILAAKRVLDYLPNTRFLMVGGGDMERELIELTARLGISDKVVFTGFLRGYNRTRVYQASDLFVMPSVSEPFGLVALESLLHNTPVILSKQSGVTEVVKNALTVDFWDVDSLVNLIVSTLQHQSLNNELVTNGKREAIQATWDRAAQRCKEIYKEMMNSKVVSLDN